MPAYTVCPICQKSFSHDQSAKRRFCSAQCYAVSMVRLRTCPQCGVGFRASNCKQKLCGKKCQTESQRIRTEVPAAIDGAAWIDVGRGLFALIDKLDEPLVAVRKWSHRKASGVVCLDERPMLILSRLLMQPPDDMIVDHRDGNRLDNRRGNLRVTTDLKNSWNRRKTPGAFSSQYKGVAWHAGHRKWRAQIQPHGQAISLGAFDVEEDAARAYDAAAREHYGEFACVNFPKDGERSALVATTFAK